MEKYLIPVITGSVGAFLSWLITKKKNNADAQLSEVEGVEIATKIWRELAEEMTKKVDELRKLVDELKIENGKLQQEINELKLRA